MTSPHRKRRGAATQALVARWLQLHGWPFATTAGAGVVGRDVLNVPGIAIEVKGRRDFTPTAWLKQVQAYAGADVPVVVSRPDGYGEARLPDWPVTMTLATFARLAHEASYGTCPDPKLCGCASTDVAS